MLDRMHFDEHLDQLSLPAQVSIRGYSPNQLIKQFMTSIWCGANRFEHCGITKHDKVIQKSSGFKQVVRCKDFGRFFSKHRSANNLQISPSTSIQLKRLPHIFETAFLIYINT